MLAAIHGGFACLCTWREASRHLNVFWWQSETLRRAATFELLISAVGDRSHLCAHFKLRQAVGCAKREMHPLAETVDFQDAQPPVRWSRAFISCPSCELNANWPAWNVCEVEVVIERFLFMPLQGAYFTVVRNKSLALWAVQVGVFLYGRDLRVLEAAFRLLVSATDCRD